MTDQASDHRGDGHAETLRQIHDRLTERLEAREAVQTAKLQRHLFWRPWRRRNPKNGLLYCKGCRKRLF